MNTGKNKNLKRFNFAKSFFVFPISPVRQFRHVIIVCFLVFLGILAFHMRLLYQVQYVDMQQTEAGQAIPIPTINETKLESVLGMYSRRLKTQIGATSIVSPVVDPSL